MSTQMLIKATPKLVGEATPGDRVKIFREEEGITQNAFAKKIGWGQEKLSRVENNKYAMSAQDLLDIVIRSGASADYILTGQEPKLRQKSKTSITTDLIDFREMYHVLNARVNALYKFLEVQKTWK